MPNRDGSACSTDSAAFADLTALKIASDNCLALEATGAACCAASTAGGSQANCASSDGLACGVARCNEIASWNTALVTDMGGGLLAGDSAVAGTGGESGYAGYPNFNADISVWDVSAVTSFYSFLYAAAAFNQDISSWDVSSFTAKGDILFGASAMGTGFTEPSKPCTASGSATGTLTWRTC